MTEVSSSRFRGRLVFLLNVLFGFGAMITSLAAIWLIPHYGWRSMFVIGGLPVVLAFILPRILPESPRWIAERGDAARAGRAMASTEDSVSGFGKRPLPPVLAEPIAPRPTPAHFRNLFAGGYALRTLTAWMAMFSAYVGEIYPTSMRALGGRRKFLVSDRFHLGPCDSRPPLAIGKLPGGLSVLWRGRSGGSRYGPAFLH
ncbi:MFS transporter [Bradyrhizobium diazoefficiens]|uniref:MFS transporter n=1 Tax=Bradyrhizobium diazoefficiens TaxID=1355477 RepID=UPI003908B5E5